MARSCQLVKSLNGIFVLTLLLLVAVVFVHGKPANLPATAAENRNACKLVFHLKSNSSSGQYYITSLRIPSLDKIIQHPSLAELDKISIGNACKPSIELMHDKDIISQARQSNSPKYMELIDEANEDATQPLYEEQAVIYPHELFNAYQQHFDVNPISSVRQNNTSHTTTTTTTESPNSVHVLENYKRFEPDGTGEYKLTLSNGMRVFKRIYKKMVNGTEIFAQTGHYSVPRTDGRAGFFTQHYVADENGFRVYMERP